MSFQSLTALVEHHLGQAAQRGTLFLPAALALDKLEDEPLHQARGGWSSFLCNRKENRVARNRVKVTQ